MNASKAINHEEHSRATGRGSQCVLVEVEPHHLLVPRTLVAEVVRYEGAALVASANPDIRLFFWRGFQVPVLNSTLIHAECVEPDGEDCKIIVFYGLSNHTKLPYYGVVASRNPHLVAVTEGNVVLSGDQQNLSAAQGAIVTVEGETAIIPKVDYLEKFIFENGLAA